MHFDILYRLHACVCTFQPGDFTGWGSEGVKRYQRLEPGGSVQGGGEGWEAGIRGGGGRVFCPVNATLTPGLTFLEQQSAILLPFFFSRTSSFLTLVLPTFFFLWLLQRFPPNTVFSLDPSCTVCRENCGLSFSLSADHCRVFLGPDHSGYGSAKAKNNPLPALGHYMAFAVKCF